MIKLLKTVDNKYIYDSNIHKLFRLKENRWDELKDYNEKFIPKLEKFAWIHGKGIGNESYVKELYNQTVDIVEDLLENNLQTLILQVTQNCNLRCEYCVYSDNYEGRIHSYEKMDEKTAKQAIDFFMSRAKATPVVNINFYGGEPLLNIELIQRIVVYMKEKYAERRVIYGITTNGTLLSDIICEFLEKEEFRLVISLDGNKAENDKNRKFADGRGTFNIVEKNIRKIKDSYAELWERTSFNRVKAVNHNLCECEKFFKESLFSDRKVSAEYVTDNNVKKNLEYTEDNVEYEAIMESKAILAILGKIDKEELDDSWKFFCDDIERTLYNVRVGRSICEKAHPSGICISGKDRTFVNVDGNIYPCERCNEESSDMKIGNVFEGFNYDNIRKQMNVGIITEECKDCWAFQLCNICQAQSEYMGKICKEGRKSKCTKVKKIMEEKLITCCYVAEKGK